MMPTRINYMKKNHILPLFAILVMIVIFAFIAYFTISTPLCGDDMRFLFSCRTGERLRTFTDALDSQIYHYFNGLGRFFVHLLTQIFLIFDKVWFDIANTFCYILTTLLIALFCGRTFNLYKWLIVALTFWIVMPHTGCTIFTVTGSFNYLWSVLFNVALLLLLFSEKRCNIVVILFVSLLAGHAHEAIAVGMIVSLILYNIFSQKKSIITIVATIIYIIGFITNAFAPSTLNRIDQSTGIESYTIMAYILKFSSHTFKLCLAFVENGDIGLFISLFMALVTLCVCLMCKFRHIKSKWLLPTTCLLIGCFMSLSLNVYTAVLYSRAFFGFNIMAYLAFLFMVFNLKEDIEKYILSILTMCSVVLASIEIPKAHKSIDLFSKRYTYIENEAKKGIDIIPEHELWQECCFSKYVEAFGIGAHVGVNYEEAKYWKTDEFSVFPRDMYNLVINNKHVLLDMGKGEYRYFSKNVVIICLENKPKTVKNVYVHNYKQSKISKLLPNAVVQIYADKVKERTLIADAPVFHLSGKYFAYCVLKSSSDTFIVEYPDKSLEFKFRADAGERLIK